MLRILRPFLSNYRTQGFGANNACTAVDAKGKIVWPYKITSKVGGVCRAGSIDFYTAALNMKGHNGLDNAIYNGEKIYFPVLADTDWYAKGEVDSSGGIGLDVISKSLVAIDILPLQTGAQAKKIWNENNGFIHVKFRFHHAKLNIPADGSRVAPGFFIQKGDSTGASSGNHCHWAMKFCDSQGNTLDKDNGYYGAVDFKRWFENIFILDEIKRITRKLAEDVEEVTYEEKLATSTPLKTEYLPSLTDRIIAAINSFLGALRGKQ